MFLKEFFYFFVVFYAYEDIFSPFFNNFFRQWSSELFPKKIVKGRSKHCSCCSCNKHHIYIHGSRKRQISSRNHCYFRRKRDDTTRFDHHHDKNPPVSPVSHGLNNDVSNLSKHKKNPSHLYGFFIKSQKIFLLNLEELYIRILVIYFIQSFIKIYRIIGFFPRSTCFIHIIIKPLEFFILEKSVVFAPNISCENISFRVPVFIVFPQ